MRLRVDQHPRSFRWFSEPLGAEVTLARVEAEAVGEAPSIANVVAQVAISGSVKSGSSSAPEHKVVQDMVELGVDQAAAQYAVNRAVELGVVRRSATGKHISVQATRR